MCLCLCNFYGRQRAHRQENSSDLNKCRLCQRRHYSTTLTRSHAFKCLPTLCASGRPRFGEKRGPCHARGLYVLTNHLAIQHTRMWEKRARHLGRQPALQTHSFVVTWQDASMPVHTSLKRKETHMPSRIGRQTVRASDIHTGHSIMKLVLRPESGLESEPASP